MDILLGLLFGLVEGLTEFAPISSTGHMILLGHLLGFEGTVRATTFEVVIQLGAILAVVVVFWKRLLWLAGLRNIGRTSHVEEDRRNRETNHLNLLHILLGILPAVIVGGLFHDDIKQHLFSATTVLWALVAGGILMMIADRFRKARATAKSLDQITYKQALIVGLFQCLSLWPGFSRSGSTISGGLLVGMDHKTASEFSFILAVPMMVAATGKDLLDNWQYLSIHDIPLFITGFVTAFVVALVAIRYLPRLIESIKLTPFAVYRFVLAAIYGFLLL